MKIEVTNLNFIIDPKANVQLKGYDGTLVIDGYQSAQIKNRCIGSLTQLEPLDKKGEHLVAAAKEYIFPKVEKWWFTPFECDSSQSSTYALASYVDKLSHEVFQEQQLQIQVNAAKEDMKRTIIFGVYGLGHYSYRPGRRVDYLMQSEDGRQKIVSIIKEKILPKLPEGMSLLNDNFTPEMYQAVGRQFFHKSALPKKERTVKTKNKGNSKKM